MHTIEEFRRHPLTQHHAMARTYEHPEVGTLTLPASPLLFAQTKTQDVGPAPTLGQHTNEVLRCAGYDDSELADLRNRKVIR